MLFYAILASITVTAVLASPSDTDTSAEVTDVTSMPVLPEYAEPEFTPWSQWSDICVQGDQVRVRGCYQVGTATCIGDRVQTRPCAGTSKPIQSEQPRSNIMPSHSPPKPGDKPEISLSLDAQPWQAPVLPSPSYSVPQPVPNPPISYGSVPAPPQTYFPPSPPVAYKPSKSYAPPAPAYSPPAPSYGTPSGYGQIPSGYATSSGGYNSLPANYGPIPPPEDFPVADYGSVSGKQKLKRVHFGSQVVNLGFPAVLANGIGGGGYASSAGNAYGSSGGPPSIRPQPPSGGSINYGGGYGSPQPSKSYGSAPSNYPLPSNTGYGGSGGGYGAAPPAVKPSYPAPTSSSYGSSSTGYSSSSGAPSIRPQPPWGGFGPPAIPISYGSPPGSGYGNFAASKSSYTAPAPTSYGSSSGGYGSSSGAPSIRPQLPASASISYGAPPRSGYGMPPAKSSYSAPAPSSYASSGGYGSSFGAPSIRPQPPSSGGYGSPVVPSSYGSPVSSGGYGFSSGAPSIRPQLPASASISYGAPPRSGYGMPPAKSSYSAPASSSYASSGGYGSSSGAPSIRPQPPSSGGYGPPVVPSSYGAPVSSGGYGSSFGAPSIRPQLPSSGGYGLPVVPSSYGVPVSSGGYGSSHGAPSIRPQPPSTSISISYGAPSSPGYGKPPAKSSYSAPAPSSYAGSGGYGSSSGAPSIRPQPPASDGYGPPAGYGTAPSGHKNIPGYSDSFNYGSNSGSGYGGYSDYVYEPEFYDSIYGTWTQWGAWGACQCGAQSRTRSCEYDKGGFFSKGCYGDSYEFQYCSNGTCNTQAYTLPPPPAYGYKPYVEPEPSLGFVVALQKPDPWYGPPADSYGSSSYGGYGSSTGGAPSIRPQPPSAGSYGGYGGAPSIRPLPPSAGSYGGYGGAPSIRPQPPSTYASYPSPPSVGYGGGGGGSSYSPTQKQRRAYALPPASPVPQTPYFQQAGTGNVYVLSGYETPGVGMSYSNRDAHFTTIEKAYKALVEKLRQRVKLLHKQ